ncbi:protein of unknown function [Denitratisoma oestradiolicum]|uniref:Uncharacterized protein n=1 Tax=Denitratisoma oestradiolicum TaxID=311182 RepID=A0A6S6XTG7_9PROT|nr:protein of unknown function [Denitratisoma oestradiolicum]
MTARRRSPLLRLPSRFIPPRHSGFSLARASTPFLTQAELSENVTLWQSPGKKCALPRREGSSADGRSNAT